MTTSSEVTEHLVFIAPQPEQKRTKFPQRRPGPKNPKYGISPALWPDVLRRADQGESLRELAKAYSVSYQTIWRILHAIRKQQHGGEA